MNVIDIKKKRNEYLGDGCEEEEEEEEEVVKGERRSEEDERHDGEAKEYWSLQIEQTKACSCYCLIDGEMNTSSCVLFYTDNSFHG